MQNIKKSTGNWERPNKPNLFLRDFRCSIIAHAIKIEEDQRGS